MSDINVRQKQIDESPANQNLSNLFWYQFLSWSSSARNWNNLKSNQETENKLKNGEKKNQTKDKDNKKKTIVRKAGDACAFLANIFSFKNGWNVPSMLLKTMFATSCSHHCWRAPSWKSSLPPIFPKLKKTTTPFYQPNHCSYSPCSLTILNQPCCTHLVEHIFKEKIVLKK